MTSSARVPRLSVLMPTYKHAHFITRALMSLQAQTITNWELLIVDDGSPDATYKTVKPFLIDSRIHYHRLPRNQGLGAALNVALSQAQTPLIAYLPSDDIFYANHLSSLLACLDAQPQAILAYSGVRHHYNRSAPGQIENCPLQLVQVLHHKTADLWLERDELVTDDLNRMYWSSLSTHGAFAGTELITCTWTDHPHQRHKILQEPLGGINSYRAFYSVQQPLRFHTTTGNFSDEIEHYRRFRERPATPTAPDGLKILLVGELAYNPERILALEERGHTLYGLWMSDPYWYNTVGPLPFGHVVDIPRANWQEEVRKLQPDIIYALLNWQAVPFAHHVLTQNPGIPFVWHFKEGPFICLEKGLWSQLVDLYMLSTAQIYSSPEMHDWFATFLPAIAGNATPSLVLDGDLPKQDWFTTARSPLLSSKDGTFHTVVPGRPIGLHPHSMGELAAHNIHLHFYGDFTHGQWATWINQAMQLAPRHLHLHRHVDQEQWVSEFSQYDAGWLHFFKSDNGGELRRSTWDDLNYPARIATLAVAGLPLLQYDNADATVATQSLAKQLDIGLFFTNMQHLREQLEDSQRMAQLRENSWASRAQFTFDYHADKLLAFFRQVLVVAQQ